MVKTKGNAQNNDIIKLNKTGNLTVKLSEHRSLNFTKGVIYFIDLMGVEEKKIVDEKI